MDSLRSKHKDVEVEKRLEIQRFDQVAKDRLLDVDCAQAALKVESLRSYKYRACCVRIATELWLFFCDIRFDSNSYWDPIWREHLIFQLWETEYFMSC